MAALSSTQSGNFNSASTWGGTSPSDGDTFTINRGHEVIVNSDLRPTNGYGDIQVYGHLKFETNAKFRLNGRITVRGYNTAANNVSGGAWFTKGNSATAGLFSSSGNNMLLEVRGTNDDQHGIWVETERYASMKLEASQKRTNTTTDESITYNSPYIPVANASNFAIGDWISVYKEQEDERVQGDEGFWVHDVDTSSGRIYIRQFVAPSSTIEDINGNNVKVTDARVFRIGYKVICGTGSNRTIATINDINYARNTLVTSVTLNGNNEGGTLYQTGCEKDHPSGKVVEKIATTLKTAITSTNSTNQITVGSSADIAVGDTIIIDSNNDDDKGWDYNTEYNVTAKSGNTLTLSSNVRHKHKEGSLVQILTRNFTIKGIDTSTRAFLYVEYWTDYNNASTRHITLKNVRFTQFGGNTKSTYYRGVMIAGYNSRKRDDDTGNYHQHQTTIQGVVMDNSTNKQSYTGLSTRHAHSCTLRNCVIYNTGQQGIWNWSSTHNLKMYNNYVTRTGYSSIQQDACYEPWSEVSYNYLTRSDDYGYMIHNFREQTPIRHNIILNHEQRCMYLYYSNHEMILERMYIDGFRYVPYIGTANGTLNFLDSYLDNRWFKSIDTDTNGILDSNRYLGYGTAESRANYDRDHGNQCTFISYEHNFKNDAKLLSNGGGVLLQDSSTQGNYKVFNQTSSKLVYKKQVYVPANTTVRISSFVKCSATGSYSYPTLLVKNVSKFTTGLGRYGGGYTGNTSTQGSSNKDFQGFYHSVGFSASSRGNWEEKQITVQPQDKGYFMMVGILSNDNARDEVHEMKDINIFFDKAPAVKKDNNHGKGVAVRSTFSRSKKRIGGTRL